MLLFGTCAVDVSPAPGDAVPGVAGALSEVVSFGAGGVGVDSQPPMIKAAAAPPAPRRNRFRREGPMSLDPGVVGIVVNFLLAGMN